MAVLSGSGIDLSSTLTSDANAPVTIVINKVQNYHIVQCLIKKIHSFYYNSYTQRLISGTL